MSEIDELRIFYEKAKAHLQLFDNTEPAYRTALNRRDLVSTVDRARALVEQAERGIAPAQSVLDTIRADARWTIAPPRDACLSTCYDIDCPVHGGSAAVEAFRNPLCTCPPGAPPSDHDCPVHGIDRYKIAGAEKFNDPKVVEAMQILAEHGIDGTLYEKLIGEKK